MYLMFGSAEELQEFLQVFGHNYDLEECEDFLDIVDPDYEIVNNWRTKAELMDLIAEAVVEDIELFLSDSFEVTFSPEVIVYSIPEEVYNELFRK